MPFIPVANTVMAELRMTLDGQNVENTLYFEYAAVPSGPTMIQLAEFLIDWWENHYRELCGLGVQLREVFITDLTTPTGGAVGVAPDAALIGNVASPELPSNVTIAVSFRTAFRGRSFRGRNYFVGLTEGQVVQNQVDTSVLNSLKAAYDVIRTTVSTIGATWVVVSRFTNNAPRIAGVTTPVESVTITDSVIDSQRGRLPGRGT